MIEETGRLMNEYGITKEHAEEIINIFFECVTSRTYPVWLKECVRVFPAHEGTAKIVDDAQAAGFAYWYGENNICEKYNVPEGYILFTQADEMEEAGILPDYSRAIIEALERCKTKIELEVYDDRTDLDELVYTMYECGFNLYHLLDVEEVDYESVFNAVEDILSSL